MAYVSKGSLEIIAKVAEKSFEGYEKQYGEGWPWPKKERVPGTYYRTFVSQAEDAWLLVSEGEDRIRRAVEVEGEFIRRVISKRRLPAGAIAFAAEDYETILAGHIDVWVTNRPAKEWDLEVLARALWETDEAVRSWVLERADAKSPKGEEAKPTMGHIRRLCEKVRAAFDKAWEREDPPAQDALGSSKKRFVKKAVDVRMWLGTHGLAEQARVLAARKEAAEKALPGFVERAVVHGVTRDAEVWGPKTLGVLTDVKD